MVADSVVSHSRRQDRTLTLALPELLVSSSTLAIPAGIYSFKASRLARLRHRTPAPQHGRRCAIPPHHPTPLVPCHLHPCVHTHLPALGQRHEQLQKLKGVAALVLARLERVGLVLRQGGTAGGATLEAHATGVSDGDSGAVPGAPDLRYLLHGPSGEGQHHSSCLVTAAI